MAWLALSDRPHHDAFGHGPDCLRDGLAVLQHAVRVSVAFLAQDARAAEGDERAVAHLGEAHNGVGHVGVELERLHDGAIGGTRQQALDEYARHGGGELGDDALRPRPATLPSGKDQRYRAQGPGLRSCAVCLW
jgi:hypothetical protein